MLDGWVDWLKELTVFIVLCETLLSFAPSSAYKRYIKPFVGLILLLRISSFLIGNVEMDWSKKMDETFLEYEQSVSQYLENVSNEEETDKNIKLKEDLIRIEPVNITPIKIGEDE